jgi:hypothetical protein
MTAEQLLNDAARLLAERGKEYDKDRQQERSMGQIVRAFNVISGQNLTELEGWLFMQTLKLVRLHNSPTFHKDSAMDAIAYTALAAECGLATESDRLEFDPDFDAIMAIGGEPFAPNPSDFVDAMGDTIHQDIGKYRVPKSIGHSLTSRDIGRKSAEIE